MDNKQKTQFKNKSVAHALVAAVIDAKNKGIDTSKFDRVLKQQSGETDVK